MVNSTSAWNVSSKPDWCTLSPDHGGHGDTPVTVSVGIRNESNPTTGQITLLSADGTSAVIEVVQSLTDREALIELYNATNGPGWTTSTNWTSSAPLSDWYGIMTDADGRVINVNLDGNTLQGTIPPSIGSLTQLQALNFTTNQLTGSIPASVWTLTGLRVLGMGSNQLTGTISGISNLVNLTNVHLSYNQLSGGLPPNLGDLTGLLYFSVDNNNMTGVIPESITGLTQFQLFNLSSNGFSGPIPENIGSVTTLVYLYLSHNNLTGNIPASVADLTLLDTFNVSKNLLSGTVPQAVQDMPQWSTFVGNNWINPQQNGNTLIY